MSYRVIKRFVDLQDNNFKYEVGDEFPRHGLKVESTRIDELATDKNRRRTPLIEHTTETAPEAKEEPGSSETGENTGQTSKPKKRPKKS